MVPAGSVQVCFVLSAGRTGTVALANQLRPLLNNALVLHEPAVSRFELLLGNLRNDTGMGAALLRSMFLRTRRRRLAELPPGGGYVEINPLLSPVADILMSLGVPFNLVHMVREPSSWAQSITAFGASDRFRAIIDYVPFAKPYPSPRPPGWSEMPEIERALWRWRVCNERIVAIRAQSARYALVRYEDAFAQDAAARSKAFSAIFDLMPGGVAEPVASMDPSARHNPAPRPKAMPPSPEKVRVICGDLMHHFGYPLG